MGVSVGMGYSINRRKFLQLSIAAGAALCVEAQERKLILGAPLTHSDWILKAGTEWGEPGVRHMLDACKASGWSRVYWRVLDGGTAMYKSKLVRPDHWDEDSFWNPQTEADKKLVEQYTSNMPADQRAAMYKKLNSYRYDEFDTLAAAVKYGHEIGLEIHAWVSINEDDHGWGLSSSFAKSHPECRWVKRDGTAYHSQMSFAFAEVRAYKLGILEELLNNYQIDGIFLDWIRTGDVRDNPQTDAQGVADSGYEKPLVEAFKKEFGVDPREVPNGDARWVRVRSKPQAEFMREARRMVGKKPLSVMVGHPWHYRGLQNKIDGNLRGLLLDVAGWAKEGLMDSVVGAGYYRDGGNAETAYRALREETGGKVDVWVYGWVPQNVGDVQRDCDLAEKVGARQVLFWEADYIVDRKNAAEVQGAMRKRAGFPV
jgi:hypothetical protein